MVCIALQGYPFGHTHIPEYVMTPSYPLHEPKTLKQGTQLVETDICIRTTTENPLQKLFMATQT